MARPLESGKKSVDLATAGPRVSRIRRDPPPKVVEKQVDVDELDRRATIIGVLAFTAAICVIIFAVGQWSGWSPRQYTVEWNSSE